MRAGSIGDGESPATVIDDSSVAAAKTEKNRFNGDPGCFALRIGIIRAPGKPPRLSRVGGRAAVLESSSHASEIQNETAQLTIAMAR
jgi:hypothetical protein